MRIEWYEVPRGHSLLSYFAVHPASWPSPIYVGSGGVVFRDARAVKLRIALTKEGKTLLKGAGHKLELTALGTFSPENGRQAARSIRTFVVRR
jgi:hypothetical protein